MKICVYFMALGLAAGVLVTGGTTSSEARSVVKAKGANHRIFVPAHWDEASQSYIYPEYITVKPHTPGHRHYAKRYRAVRVHEGMTFKRSRTVIEASFCGQPFNDRTSKYRGKQRVFRVCP